MNIYDFEKNLFLIMVSLQKWLAHFFCKKKMSEFSEKMFQELHRESGMLINRYQELNTYKQGKRQYLPHYG